MHKDIDWEVEQDQIRDYCNNHELVRPNINWLWLIIVIISYLLVSILLIVVSFLLTDNLYIWTIDICLLFPLLFYGNILGVAFIEIYQRYASESSRRQCSCKPSCSEYAILAFKKYYWMKALF
jgi:Uncharacterized conserved protein